MPLLVPVALSVVTMLPSSMIPSKPIRLLQILTCDAMLDFSEERGEDLPWVIFGGLRRLLPGVQVL